MNHTIKAFSLVLGLFLTTSSFAIDSEITEAARRYQILAQDISNEVQDMSPSDRVILAKVQEMLTSARVVAEGYARLRSNCSGQVAKIIELYPQLINWSANDIRHNIDAGWALPQAEGCYNVRAIIARPAVVQSIVRFQSVSSQQSNIVREMQAAVNYMDEVVDEFQKSSYDLTSAN